MPRQLLPRDLSVHRVACKALYRSLIQQCLHIPLPADISLRGPVNPIQHLVRRYFRRHVNETSPLLVIAALKAGYIAEQLLCNAASGNKQAISQIHGVLYQSTEIASARASSSLPPSTPVRPRVWPYPGAPKVLDIRPVSRESLTGLRKVPILTEASGFPFLRFRRPQSPFLSRVIRDKLKQKFKRYEWVQSMEADLEYAREEEQWEKLVRLQLKAEGSDEMGRQSTRVEEKWGNSIEAAKNEMWHRYVAENRRWKGTAEKMLEIERREKVMCAEERRLRGRERSIVKNERKEVSNKA